MIHERNVCCDLSLFVSPPFSVSSSVQKDVIGVIEHLDCGDDGRLDILSPLVWGVNALSNKGELVAEDETVETGVSGRKEKLFEEDFAGGIGAGVIVAGAIVVELTRAPGSRVMLKGRD